MTVLPRSRVRLWGENALMYSQCYVTVVMLSLFLLVIRYIFSLEWRGRMETNNKLLRFSLVLRYHLHKIKFTYLKSVV